MVFFKNNKELETDLTWTFEGIARVATVDADVELAIAIAFHVQDTTDRIQCVKKGETFYIKHLAKLKPIAESNDDAFLRNHIMISVFAKVVITLSEMFSIRLSSACPCKAIIVL